MGAPSVVGFRSPLPEKVVIVPKVKFANAVIADVADEQITVVIKLNAVRLIEPRTGGDAAVAEKSRLSHASNRRDDFGFSVHAPDNIVLHFHEEHVSRSVEPHFIRLIRLGAQGWATITGVAALAGSRDRGNRAIPGDAPDRVIRHITNIERAIGAAGQAVGIIELSFCGWTAIAGAAGLASARQGGDLEPEGVGFGCQRVRDSSKSEGGDGQQRHDTLFDVFSASAPPVHNPDRVSADHPKFSAC
jgi:hypothetical protein